MGCWLTEIGCWIREAYDDLMGSETCMMVIDFE
jgi:hypothetical protein